MEKPISFIAVIIKIFATLALVVMTAFLIFVLVAEDKSKFMDIEFVKSYFILYYIVFVFIDTLIFGFASIIQSLKEISFNTEKGKQK